MKSGPKPSAIVGCARTASRSAVNGIPANIAVCTTAITSPASGPTIAKTEYAIVVADKRLHEPARFRNRSSPEHRSNRQLRNAGIYAFRSRRGFAHADPPEWWIGEHAIRYQTIFCTARAACKVIADDTEIIESGVGELRSTCALTHRPGFR